MVSTCERGTKVYPSLPFKAKYYMVSTCERGTKVYLNDPGQTTKMAAMPKYGINPSYFFPEPVNVFQ